MSALEREDTLGWSSRHFVMASVSNVSGRASALTVRSVKVEAEKKAKAVTVTTNPRRIICG